MDPIQRHLEQFDVITLPEMDKVKLQDRMDTKFVFAQERLPAVLDALKDDHRILYANNSRYTDYRTLYYDTEKLNSFLDHHNGRTFRFKVRKREYVGADLCFLEVKRKGGRGRTDKVRKKLGAMREEITSEEAAFIHASCKPSGPLQPVLWNSFTRITLVNKKDPERLTIDHSLRFSNNGAPAQLSGIVIAELKQSRMDHNSSFIRLMKRMGIRPQGMSKYCVGTVLMHPDLKHNNFKPVLRELARIRKAA